MNFWWSFLMLYIFLMDSWILKPKHGRNRNKVRKNIQHRQEFIFAKGLLRKVWTLVVWEKYFFVIRAANRTCRTDQSENSIFQNLFYKFSCYFLCSSNYLVGQTQNTLTKLQSEQLDVAYNSIQCKLIKNAWMQYHIW